MIINKWNGSKEGIQHQPLAFICIHVYPHTCKCINICYIHTKRTINVSLLLSLITTKVLSITTVKHIQYAIYCTVQFVYIIIWLLQQLNDIDIIYCIFSFMNPEIFRRSKFLYPCTVRGITLAWLALHQCKPILQFFMGFASSTMNLRQTGWHGLTSLL